MCSCHCSFTVVDGIFCVLLEVVLLEANTVLFLRSVVQVSCCFFTDRHLLHAYFTVGALKIKS